MNYSPDEPWKSGGQRAVAFVEQHGGNPVYDKYTRMYLLPTGAKLTLDGKGIQQPPARMMDRLKAKRLYWDLVIERTLDHMQELSALTQGRMMSVRWKIELYGPKPGPTVADAHAHLKKLLDEYSAEREKAHAELLHLHAHPELQPVEDLVYTP